MRAYDPTMSMPAGVLLHPASSADAQTGARLHIACSREVYGSLTKPDLPEATSPTRPPGRSAGGSRSRTGRPGCWPMSSPFFHLADAGFDVTSAEVHRAWDEDWNVETAYG